LGDLQLALDVVQQFSMALQTAGGTGSGLGQAFKEEGLRIPMAIRGG